MPGLIANRPEMRAPAARVVYLLLALWFLLCPGAGAEDVDVYDENYRLQYRLRGDKVYDRDYRLKFRADRNKVYDENYRLRYRLERKR